MKKLAVVILMLAFNATPSVAQGIEFSGGVNMSKISGAAVQNAVRELGMNFGIDFVIPMGPVGFNLGGAFSQKGVETGPDAVDLSYIEFPIHVRLPIVKAGPARLNLIVGPTIGINTGCKISSATSVAEDCADAVGSGLDPKKLDWSGTGGLGFSLHVGGLAYAGVELTYTAGLSSFNQLQDDLKNRTFSLQSHFGFDIF